MVSQLPVLIAHVLPAFLHRPLAPLAARVAAHPATVHREIVGHLLRGRRPRLNALHPAECKTKLHTQLPFAPERKATCGPAEKGRPEPAECGDLPPLPGSTVGGARSQPPAHAGEFRAGCRYSDVSKKNWRMGGLPKWPFPRFAGALLIL